MDSLHNNIRGAETLRHFAMNGVRPFDGTCAEDAAQQVLRQAFAITEIVAAPSAREFSDTIREDALQGVSRLIAVASLLLEGV